MRDYDPSQGILTDKTLILLVDFCFDTQTNFYAAYLHDAIILYALALNETISETGSFTDGRNVSKSMIGKNFDGKVVCTWFLEK